MRLIDADSLETHEQLESFGNGNYEYVDVVYKDDIDDAPTIEPEQRKGEWIWQMYENIYRCSKCETETHVDECMEEPIYNYCPYCGARMDGES